MSLRGLSMNHPGTGYTFKAGTKLKEKFAAAVKEHGDETTRIGVCLTADNTVDLGIATPTAAHTLFGVVTSISHDGFVTMSKDGIFDDVPASGTIARGTMDLAVNDKGEVVAVTDATSGWTVIVGKDGLNGAPTITVLR